MITLLAEIQLPEDHGEEDGELDDVDGELDGEDGELDDVDGELDGEDGELDDDCG